VVAILEQASPIGGTHPTPSMRQLTNYSRGFPSSSRGIKQGWVAFVETGRPRCEEEEAWQKKGQKLKEKTRKNDRRSLGQHLPWHAREVDKDPDRQT
jgi:hypothetical protein